MDGKTCLGQIKSFSCYRIKKRSGMEHGGRKKTACQITAVFVHFDGFFNFFWPFCKFHLVHPDPAFGAVSLREKRSDLFPFFLPVALVFAGERERRKEMKRSLCCSKKGGEGERMETELSERTCQGKFVLHFEDCVKPRLKL